ncbi:MULTISPECIES: MFS transporter [Pseudomonas]|uniref:MFS transporter n=1 Tax=Pseudomonas TaxID=286 RepID=UPI00073135E1|nr:MULTISPECIES: MFS transporter [Pseudomonas]KTC24749.1 MFS transporter [Pseudomonas putida]WKL64770.1 MFS transporter [Pseudomonas qingdaonensis]
MATIDSTSTGSAPRRGITKEERKVIFASSLGTVFEWYDFYLYGSLAAIIAKHFFAGVNETTAFIFALLAFAAGFAVRPFGAIVFGRLGDMIGRKHTFLITIVIMGVSTAVVGLLPSYSSIGVAAPVILITLRLLQGLALGGEYGGAATYVAEHAPPGKRGFFTSWIQTTATLGLFLSLLVILACRTALGTEAFEAWGWRIPFLLSILLLIVSVYIRLQLSESPVFNRMKAEGKASRAPLTESFARWDNLKVVIMSLLGGTAGQAVVWYTGQFYALFFLLQTLKIDPQTANLLIAGSLLIGTPFFVIFGSLSDRIGRKGIIMAGCILAALTYFPIFHALTQYGNPDVFSAQARNPVTVVADPAQCSFQFDPVGKARFTSSCDVAKSVLAKRAIPYVNEKAEPGSVAQVRIGSTVVPSFDGSRLPAADFKTQNDAFAATLGAALKDAGYPEKADPNKTNYPMVLLLLTILVIYVTMVYGPIAAWLVELFPARIRYTSMSLPYHIGNGWFGGFLPTVAFAMVAATGDIYYGLWYPIVIAVMTAILGTFFLPETKDRDINHS